MKKILNKFYNINIEDYKEYDEGIIFFISSDCFYLYKIISEDVLFVNNIYDYLISNYNLKLHSFVKNKNNELVSDGYVLMKLNVMISDIDMYDINLFAKCDMNEFKKYYNNGFEGWMKRLDYYTEKIKECEFDQVRYLCDYYIGISEMLLKFLSDIDLSSFDLYLSHKKNYNNTIDYYNPFNLTVDLINYDYIRRLNDDKLINIVDDNYNKRKYMFFKLVFPYEFFDLLDDCINCNKIDILSERDVFCYEEKFDRYQELFGYYLFPIKKSN